MDEMQSIINRIETDRNDLEAWQRLGELVDDPQKKNDCRAQVARINRELAGAEAPTVVQPNRRASAAHIPVTAKLLRGKLLLIIIIASNLLPIFGLLFLGWSMGSVMILYWVENIMVGFFTLLKMIFADEQAGMWLVRLPAMLFFCVHFGGFCAVHLIFILVLFMPQFHQPLNLQAIPAVFLDLLVGLWLPILGMFISYSISFYQHYLGDGVYQRVTIYNLMAEPYPRIIPMHFGLILAGFFVVALGSPIGVVILLVLLKTGAEVLAYRRSVSKWRVPKQGIQALLG
jgi:hypothetical protein